MGILHVNDVAAHRDVRLRALGVRTFSSYVLSHHSYRGLSRRLLGRSTSLILTPLFGGASGDQVFKGQPVLRSSIWTPGQNTPRALHHQ